MVLRAAALLLFMALPAGAASRDTRIAMAVALLDVAEEYCSDAVAVDAAQKRTLMIHFHEYDIAGLASTLSGPLNAFYEDFLHEARQGRDAFCDEAPSQAASTGYPVIVGKR
jgi:hypothetical protein